jgi:hypothetical protein
MIISKNIEHRMIPKDSGEFLELVDFAEEFDHKVILHPQINVMGHYKNGKLFAYSDFVYIPTVYPAFHPAHTTARDVVQTLHDWRASCQLTGTLGFLGVPLEHQREKFPNKIMKQLGFKQMEREIFSL